MPVKADKIIANDLTASEHRAWAKIVYEALAAYSDERFTQEFKQRTQIDADFQKGDGCGAKAAMAGISMISAMTLTLYSILHPDAVMKNPVLATSVAAIGATVFGGLFSANIAVRIAEQVYKKSSLKDEKINSFTKYGAVAGTVTSSVLAAANTNAFLSYKLFASTLAVSEVYGVCVFTTTALASYLACNAIKIIPDAIYKRQARKRRATLLINALADAPQDFHDLMLTKAASFRSLPAKSKKLSTCLNLPQENVSKAVLGIKQYTNFYKTKDSSEKAQMVIGSGGPR